jgi:hypothetical protein
VGERRVEMVPLSDLRRATRNPKAHSLPDIARSIGRFGVVDLPVVDERTGRLVAGHGRLEALEAAKAAGEQPPDGIEARDGAWLVPVVRGWSSRSDADAEAAGVALNHLTELGGWDTDAQVEMFLDHRDDDSWLVGTGYTSLDVNELLAPRGQPPVDDDPPPPVDPPERDVHHAVLVDHLTAAGQAELLARLKGEGYKARAMTS